MDDPLRETAEFTGNLYADLSLNPYCNGWSSKSVTNFSLVEHKSCLNPYCNGWSSKSCVHDDDTVTKISVLILIVMDDPLRV